METGVEKIVELNGGEHAPRKTGVNRILELLGGEPAKNKTGVDRIVEILEQGGGGGGSSLPSYTSADKGKVLTVGEGSGGEAEPKWEAASGGGIVDIALGTRTAAHGADNAIYVNGQELTTLEECATYLESVKNNVLRVYFPDYPAGVTNFYTVTGLTIYRAGNMAYGELVQKTPQTGEINVQTFGYMPASD